MRILATSVLLALVLAGGCFSVDTASTEMFRSSRMSESDSKPLEHIVVSNYGWYFFNRVPIVCGNADPRARLPFVFFRDDVNTDTVHRRLSEYALSRNAGITELHQHFNDRVLITLPGFSVPVPMPYVLSYRERNLSAVLTETPPPGAAEEFRRRQLKRELDRVLRDLPRGGVK